MKHLYLIALLVCAPSLTLGRDLFLPLPGAGMADASPALQLELAAIRARPTTKAVMFFTVDVGALQGADARLALADAPPVVASRKSIEKDAAHPQEYVWTGTLVGVPGDATFYVYDHAILGTIRNGRELYRVESVKDGVHAVIHVDQTKFPQEEPPSQTQRQSQHLLLDTMHDGPPAAPSEKSVIDVLVAYTPEAKASSPNIDALIKVAIKESNLSYSNSKVAMELRLVEILPVTKYVEPANFDRILDDFVAMKSVQTRLQATNADVAMLVVGNRAYCGLANAIGASADSAFAIVNYDCATGYYSFAHELGHLMGGRHDIAHDPATTPFADGHGFQNPAANGWRTIMAYDCTPSCPRLMYWSSPDVSFEGVPMGVAATSNDARVLNRTAKVVASFRSTAPPHVAMLKTKDAAESAEPRK